MFPDEPVAPLGMMTVSSIQSLPDMTVNELLRGILKSGAKQILLCCHGTRLGLSLPLIEGNPMVLLREFALDVLQEWTSGAIDDEAMQNGLRLTVGIRDLETFRKRIDDVRRLAVSSLELRACNVGGNEGVMKKLRRFFGCMRLAAPTMFDGYARIDPGSPTTSAAALSTFFARNISRVSEGSAPHRFFVAAHANVPTSLRFNAITESASAFQTFVKKRFPAPANAVGGSIPAHAMIPGDGNVRPIFPLDPEYRRQMRVVLSTIDPFK
jgi:hypothetical protein